jgi:hypothetical protein
MTTDNAYPKACSMEEAIACVKAGGEAQTANCNDLLYTGSLVLRDGIVYDSTSKRPLNPYGRYQITKPAPSTTTEPRTYSTAEAIMELYTGRVKKFTGKRVNGLDTLFLFSDDNGDIVATCGLYDRLQHIPNIRWSPVVEKPAAVEVQYVIPSRVHDVSRPNIDSDIYDLRQKWPGDVRVTWKVEAV